MLGRSTYGIKKRIRRTSAIITVALAGTLLAACSSGPSVSAAGSTLAIGVFNPYTGTDAAFGPEASAGCYTAIHLINESGGVLGHKFECLPTDTKGDPTDAVPIAERLIATHSNLVAIVGPSSDEALSTVPIFNRAEIPMFPDTGQAAFNKSSYKYFWRITPADNVLGEAMAVWAAKKGYLRAAAFIGNDIGSQSAVSTLVAAYKKEGGDMVWDQPIALDQSSYRTEVEQIIAAHPQVLFVVADPASAATFLSEYQQLHGLIPFIGTELSLQTPFLKAVSGAIGVKALDTYNTGMQPYAPTSGSAWEVYHSGLMASSAQVPNPSQWSADPFSQDYYDSINMMALAMLEAKSTKPSTFISDFLQVTQAGAGKVVVHSFEQGAKELKAGKQIQYVGVLGPINFDKYHNSSGIFEAGQTTGSNFNNVKAVGFVSAAEIASLGL